MSKTGGGVEVEARKADRASAAVDSLRYSAVKLPINSVGIREVFLDRSQSIFRFASACVSALVQHPGYATRTCISC